MLIDRTNNAITYVDPNTCKPRIQVSVTGSENGPYDVASISTTKSYVTRNGPGPATGMTDKGDDIVIINPTKRQHYGLHRSV